MRKAKKAAGIERPIYHHQEQRADGHLFISVIAYQAIQVLRRKMKETGENANWSTVRDILRHLLGSPPPLREKTARHCMSEQLQPPTKIRPPYTGYKSARTQLTENRVLILAHAAAEIAAFEPHNSTM